jgi:uracil-DNA glycosylase
VVALGSTAAQALLGNSFRVTQHRGEVLQSDWAGPVLATVHPSSVLRAPDEYRADARREFFEDVAKVAAYLKRTPASSRPPASPATTSPRATTSSRATTSPRATTSSRAKRGT